MTSYYVYNLELTIGNLLLVDIILPDMHQSANINPLPTFRLIWWTVTKADSEDYTLIQSILVGINMFVYKYRQKCLGERETT